MGRPDPLAGEKVESASKGRCDPSFGNPPAEDCIHTAKEKTFSYIVFPPCFMSMFMSLLPHFIRKVLRPWDIPSSEEEQKRGEQLFQRAQKSFDTSEGERSRHHFSAADRYQDQGIYGVIANMFYYLPMPCRCHPTDKCHVFVQHVATGEGRRYQRTQGRASQCHATAQKQRTLTHCLAPTKHVR